MTVRSRILAANWKMNKTVSETAEFCRIFKDLYKTNPKKGVKLVIAPPFTSLAAASIGFEGTGVYLASQNMHWEKSGAFTGEISAPMLKELGVQYLILGHSERRQLFWETDGMVNQKIKRGIEERFLIIFCIGETLRERHSGKTSLVLERQLEKGLQGIEKAALKNIIVAYEPVWAIGTGKNATADQASAAHFHIRKVLAKRFDKESAEGISILYGGSVNADNFSEVSGKPNVDGALVGGASLDPKSFIEILKGMA